MSESTRDYDLIRFPKDAWGKVPPFAYPTYVALLRYFGKKEACWPTLKTIADLVGLDRSNVKRQLRELRKIGLIVAVRQGVNGRNTYTLPDVHGGVCAPTPGGICAPSEGSSAPPGGGVSAPKYPTVSRRLQEDSPHSPPQQEDDGDDEVPAAAFDTEPPSPIIESLDKARDNRLEKARRWLALCAEAWPNVAMPSADNRQELHSIGEALDGWVIPDVSVDPFGHKLPPREVWLSLLRLAGRDPDWRERFNIRNPRTAARNAPKLIQRFVEHAQADVRQQQLRALRAQPMAEVTSA